MFVDFLLIIVAVLQILLFCYLAFGTIYIFIFSLAGLFKLETKDVDIKRIQKIALLIPGYKEDSVIIESVTEATRQDYPSDAFDVIVIADSFKPETLNVLRSISVKVIEVSFEVSTKSKALNMALAQLPDNYYDLVVVLDADNLMATDFLTLINNAFNAGLFAVQGHRIAKNINTSFALLDAASEEINNHIFRKGHRILGLSSSLIGSGMAFDYTYFKNLMKGIKAIGGFDKEIELTMLKAGIKIEYLGNAYVFDEKVQVSGVFIKQRRRWLSAQLHYSQYFFEALRHLFINGNIDFFDKSLQMLLPPRVLLLGLLPAITVLSLFFNPVLYTLAWLILTLLCIMAILFAVPGKFYNTRTLKAISDLPKGFLLMLFSLFSTKGANKKFIHTEHSATGNSKTMQKKGKP